MTDMSQPPNNPIGQPLRRREDARFLTGAGQYTDDVVLPGQSYGFFLRSPYAHARIKSIDLDGPRPRPAWHRSLPATTWPRPRWAGCPAAGSSQQGRHADEGAGAPGAGARQGAPRRRPGGAGGGRHLPAGTRCRRTDRGRLRRADAGDRHHHGRKRRLGGARRGARQRLLRLGPRQQGGRGRGLRPGSACHEAELRQQPPDPQRDRAARGQRALHAARRRLHAVRGQPEPARRAAADVRLRAGPARDTRCA